MIFPVMEALQAFLSIWNLLPAPVRLFADVVLIVGLATGILKIFVTNT